jgi:hypothetical protein
MAVLLMDQSLDNLLKARSLSRDDLRVECSAEDCNKLALKLVRWKELCPFIGLSASDEEEVDVDNRKNTGKKIGNFGSTDLYGQQNFP